MYGATRVAGETRACASVYICVFAGASVRVPLQARHGCRGTGCGEAGGTWPEWATCCISAGNERLDNILQEAPGCACLPSRGERRRDIGCFRWMGCGSS